MRAPGEPGAGAEPFGDRVGGVDGADGDLESADHAGRAGLVGQGHGVLVGEREQTVTVIGHVAAGGLGAQPLPDVALRRARARRQVGGREGPGPGHGPVEAELVADHHHGPAENGADVADRPVDELHHLGLVHC